MKDIITFKMENVVKKLLNIYLINKEKDTIR